MRNLTDKSRPTPLSTTAALPCGPGNQPGVAGVEGPPATSELLLTAADGTTAGLAVGNDVTDVFPPVGLSSNGWVGVFDAVDFGAGGVLTVSGILCDGNGVAVPFGVLDVLASTLTLLPVVPAVGTGAIGSVRPGYDGGGGLACGVACSVIADANGAFVFTLTCGIADTMYLRLRWLHVAQQYAIPVT